MLKLYAIVKAGIVIKVALLTPLQVAGHKEIPSYQCVVDVSQYQTKPLVGWQVIDSDCSQFQAPKQKPQGGG